MIAQLDLYKQDLKFHVAVDCVIFGYEDNELKLLLHPRPIKPSYNGWSLMGGFIQKTESADMAALRVLKSTVGLDNIYLEQVCGFSAPDRDPGGRVISIAYYSLIRINEHDKALSAEHGGKWFSVSKLPELIFDHAEIVEAALIKLQLKATTELIGEDLLPELFTLTQLNNLYNAIYQKSFDAGNFRKKIASLNLLTRQEIKETDTSKRGAYYYKFKKNALNENHDRIVKL